MKKTLAAIIIAVMALQVAMAITAVRVILLNPLYVNDVAAKGDVAYVLSGGNATWERLRAAADLYHLKSVEKIVLMEDKRTGAYSFIQRENWTITQWQIEYLKWLGVTESSIDIYTTESQEFFGTLKEARLVASNLPDSVSELVIVTSAPHTRRSLLAFERLLPNVTVSSYAATGIDHSTEFFNPIWVEYAKLIVYWIVA